MPNIKSAERRMRGSARKAARNRAGKSRLKTLQQTYERLIGGGKKTEAAQHLRATSSALDKAAKSGTIPTRRARRKKSRLARSLARMKEAPATAASAPAGGEKAGS